MLRASSIAPLYAGTDGLTDVQQARKKELSDRHAAWLVCEDDKEKKKLELTSNMQKELDSLLDKQKRFDNGDVDLPAGAITLLNEAAKKHVYKYRSSPFKGNRATAKGNDCESQAIDFLNVTLLKTWRKLTEDDEYFSVRWDIFDGHPDIVDQDELEVIDTKVPETKHSFPEFPEDGKNSDYEWQVKRYLVNLRNLTGKDFRRGSYIYVLISTPEELVYEGEPDDLHYVDDLDASLRYTICPVELTDADIEHMERRDAAAKKYLEQRIEKLKNKNL